MQCEAALAVLHEISDYNHLMGKALLQNHFLQHISKIAIGLEDVRG